MTAARIAAAIAESARLRREALLERIAAGIKVCRGCDRTLPLDAFTTAPSMSDGRAPYCRPCAARRERERQQAKRQKVTEEKARKRAAAHAAAQLREVLAGGPVTDPDTALDIVVAAERAKLVYRCPGCTAIATGGQKLRHPDDCKGAAWAEGLLAEAAANRVHAELRMDRLADLNRRALAYRASSRHR